MPPSSIHFEVWIHQRSFKISWAHCRANKEVLQRINANYSLSLKEHRKLARASLGTQVPEYHCERARERDREREGEGRGGREGGRDREREKEIWSWI